MFTYRCPECGKQHNNAGPFAEAYQTKCLRCSRVFDVTREMAHVAPESDSSPGRAAPPPRARGAVAPPADREGIRRSTTDPSASPKGITRTAKTKPAPRPAPAARGDDGPDAIDAGKVTEQEQAFLELAAPEPGTKRGNPAAEGPPAVPAEGKPVRPRWLVVSAVAVPVVLVLAVGGYLVFGPSGKPKQPVAKNAAPKEKPKPPPPKKVEEKKIDPVPPVTAKPPAVALAVTAPRLAAELASNPAEADAKYADAWMEVSGLFDKLETDKAAKGPPTVLARFLTEQGSVACDLSSVLTGEMAGWRTLKHGKPFNARGFYRKGGVLSKCLLAKPGARADVDFVGKTVELRGSVGAVVLPGKGAEFPTIELETGTGSVVSIRCLFKKEDLPQVKLLEEKSSVVIGGVCAGRHVEADKYFVRLDNCEFLSTTGPAPSVTRLATIDFAREFEEDLRPYYFPPPASFDKAAPALTVTQLSKEWKADGKSVGKYRNRVVAVTGRLAKKTPGLLLLESRETDQPLVVACHFARGDFDKLAELPEYRVYGVCNGMEGPQTLRLDDCGVDASQLQGDAPRLTAHYLPHKAGTTLTFDFVGHPVSGKGSAMINRQVWFQREKGVTETVITHSARFPGTSLFTPGKGENWTAGAKTSRGRLPGPVYVQMNTPLAIDFGQRMTRAKGGTSVESKLALKMGVKVGDSWEWTGENSKHSYTLVRFGSWRGSPSAVVNEEILKPLSGGQKYEVEHVFVRNLGEVERREWLHITSTEKRLLWESKMILAGVPVLGPSQLEGQ